jgi:hypothetical protein
MENTFLKLGEKASSFYDPTSGVNIRGHEVVKVNAKQMKSKKVIIALRNGHINKTDENAYKIYNGLLDAPIAAETSTADGDITTDPRYDDLMGMSKKDILDWMVTEGFDDEDVSKAEAIKDKTKRLEFILVAEKAYTNTND